MPRRKKGKLKKGAVYVLFALIFFALTAVEVLSFISNDGTILAVSGILKGYFGSLFYLTPLLTLLLAFAFLRLKFSLSKIHVLLGFIVFYFSLLGLLKTGSIGLQLYSILSEIVGTAGSDLIYIIGIVIGLIVLFDKSIDEIIAGIGSIGGVFKKLFPHRTLTGLGSRKLIVKNGKEILENKKNDKNNEEKFDKNKPLPKINTPMPTNFGSPDNILKTSNIGIPGGIWTPPSLDLLAENQNQKADRGDIKKTAAIIEKTLQSFGIDTKVAEVNLGPAVTQYALEIALGTKVSKITSLSNDLALATEAPTGQIRIEAPIPGRNLIGIEIPNKSLEVVSLKTMLSSSIMQHSKSKLTVALGLDVSGNPIVGDINKMPHLLIAGTTGSGKSITINAFITSMLFRASPSEVRFIMMDPKRVELTTYNGIPHLLHPVIVEPDQILSALRWALHEMDQRYKKFAELGVKNLESYNELAGIQNLPYVVIFIDELADLMAYAPVEVEDAIARLAQMARATGIHLVVATQRPSVDVITGLIKANIPTRIALTVASLVDSRVILDTPGAEKLLGRGDMLYIPPNQAKPNRIQGTYVSEKEVLKIVNFLKSKNPVVNYTEEITQQPTGKSIGGFAGGNGKVDDDLAAAVNILCQQEKASASLLQRKLSIGFAKAGRIMDRLEEVGMVGHANGAKPRDILIKNPDEVMERLQGN